MEREPFLAAVDSWVLQIDIRDTVVQIRMDTDKRNSHYMRLSTDQAQALKLYLWRNLPSTAEDGE